MTQYDRSAVTLELPAVLAMLEREAVSEAAKVRARALAPSADEAEVRRRLSETSAARGMMVTRGSPGFSGLKDVRASLQRADIDTGRGQKGLAQRCAQLGDMGSQGFFFRAEDAAHQRKAVGMNARRPDAD